MPVKVGKIVLVSFEIIWCTSFYKYNFSFAEPSDAKNFTVAALEKPEDVKLPFKKSESKRSPPMITFESDQTHKLLKSPSSAVVSSDNASNGEHLQRSCSLSVVEEDSKNDAKISKLLNNVKEKIILNGPKVAIPKLDDEETFQTFFTTSKSTDDKVDFDLNSITVVTERLHIQRKTVQGPKGRRNTKNPLKLLASRNDLETEYTEIKTGIAEKELKRIKLESSKNFLLSTYLHIFLFI